MVSVCLSTRPDHQIFFRLWAGLVVFSCLGQYRVQKNLRWSGLLPTHSAKAWVLRMTEGGRETENEEDSKAGEVDNTRWMFMRARSQPSSISGGFRICTRRRKAVRDLTLHLPLPPPSPRVWPLRCSHESSCGQRPRHGVFEYFTIKQWNKAAKSSIWH